MMLIDFRMQMLEEAPLCNVSFPWPGLVQSTGSGLVQSAGLGLVQSTGLALHSKCASWLRCAIVFEALYVAVSPSGNPQSVSRVPTMAGCQTAEILLSLGFLMHHKDSFANGVM